MFTLDEAIKCEYEFADFCESIASTYDMDDYYERSMAYKAGECAKEHKQIAEWLKELKQLKEQEPILDKIREEIKVKIEQEDFARSVFIHEEKDHDKAKRCEGKIKAYNNVIKLIERKIVRDK